VHRSQFGSSSEAPTDLSTECNYNDTVNSLNGDGITVETSCDPDSSTKNNMFLKQPILNSSKDEIGTTPSKLYTNSLVSMCSPFDYIKNADSTQCENNPVSEKSQSINEPLSSKYGIDGDGIENILFVQSSSCCEDDDDIESMNDKIRDEEDGSQLYGMYSVMDPVELPDDSIILLDDTEVGQILKSDEITMNYDELDDGDDEFDRIVENVVG
jgi:hypothetical protein